MAEIDLSTFCSCGEDLYWRGCYNTYPNWRRFVTAESFAHPAKMSPILCDRIFKHLKKMGLLHEDSVVCDFMAGMGTTNIVASLQGYDTIAVELEPHFVNMIEGNRNRYQRLTGKPDGWKIIQGDARELSTLLRERGYVGVVSPPFADTIGNYTHERGDLQKYYDRQKRYNEKISGTMGIKRPEPLQYSINPNNIGNLPDKPVVGIISPPYSNSLDEKKNTTSNLRREERLRTAGHLPKDFMGGLARNCQLEDGMRYSCNPKNIGNLSDKTIVGVISPPYTDMMGIKHTDCPSSAKLYKDKHWNTKYSTNRENIGAVGGETYLEAMLKVYKEAYLAGISPLVIVTKNPTRDFKLRRLDIDMAKLLLMVGYEIIDYHRAVLFEEKQQLTLIGDIMKVPKGRLGFFKRLSYNKGNVTAKWEDVIIAVA